MSDYIWLLPTLEFGSESEGFFVRSGSGKYSFGPEVLPMLDFLLSIDGNRSEVELSKSEFYGLIKPFLDEMKWVVRLKNPISHFIEKYEILTRQLSYYSHLCRNYPDLVLENLQNKKVAVIGLGGIGSLVAHNLLGSGIGSLHLFDFDSVENSNFNRQIIYNRDDLGKLKNVQCALHLAEKFPTANIFTSTINFDLQSFELGEFDLIVLCGECHGFYEKPERLDNRNVIRSGYFGSAGVIGPLFVVGGLTQWSHAVKGSNEKSFTDRNRKKALNSWNSSGASINTTIAGLLTEECVKFLAPELGQSVVLDREMRIEMSDFSITFKKFGVI